MKPLSEWIEEQIKVADKGSCSGNEEWKMNQSVGELMAFEKVLDELKAREDDKGKAHFDSMETTERKPNADHLIRMLIRELMATELYDNKRLDAMLAELKAREAKEQEAVKT